MTRRVFDEDHRSTIGKNNNGVQLLARFADFLRGSVIIKDRVLRSVRISGILKIVNNPGILLRMSEK